MLTLTIDYRSSLISQWTDPLRFNRRDWESQINKKDPDVYRIFSGCEELESLWGEPTASGIAKACAIHPAGHNWLQTRSHCISLGCEEKTSFEREKKDIIILVKKLPVDNGLLYKRGLTVGIVLVSIPAVRISVSDWINLCDSICDSNKQCVNDSRPGRPFLIFNHMGPLILRFFNNSSVNVVFLRTWRTTESNSVLKLNLNHVETWN